MTIKITTVSSGVLIIACLAFLLNLNCKTDDSIMDQQVENLSISLEKFETEIIPNLAEEQKSFFSMDYILNNHPKLLTPARQRGLPQLVKMARLNLYKQDLAANNELIPVIIEKVGYPMWTQAKSNYEDDNVLSIPFTTLQDSYITGFLFGNGYDDLEKFHFILFEKDQLDNDILNYSVEEERENLTFSVLTIGIFTHELFGVLLEDYWDWLRTDEEGLTTSDNRNSSGEICYPCNIALVSGRYKQFLITTYKFCQL